MDDFPLQMPWGAETFEVYPNRDSRPFIAQYHMDDQWNIKQFVRGTLRYKGWKNAWRPIFDKIEQGISEEELVSLSDQLWQEHAIVDGESDRVVLAVTLKSEEAGEVVWHQSYILDAFGNDEGSAMAKLVSIPVSLAIEAVINREIAAGVTAAPDKAELVERWLCCAKEISQKFSVVDHLA